jgi:GGDEF domain-containing protein
VRDHLHTLRSAIPELDPAAAATDEAPQPHTLAQLVAKWRSPPAGVGHTVSDVRVVVAAHRRERVVEAPIVIRGQSVTISTSIGVVLSGAAGWSPDEIVRVADEAMYQAKQAGKGCYQVVDHRPTPA